MKPRGEEVRVLLWSYLDGELDDPERRRVEGLLQESADLRQELAEMQQCWDLLDRAPQARSEPGYRQRVWERVGSDEGGGSRLPQSVTTLPRSRVRTYLWAACLVALAGLTLLILVSRGGDPGESPMNGPDSVAGTDRDEVLLEDLPLLEHLDFLVVHGTELDDWGTEPDSFYYDGEEYDG